MIKLLWLIVWLTLSGGMVRAAGQTPAGYLVAIALKGQDRSQKTAIVRQGKELEPRLMMPVFQGDDIFLRGTAPYAVSLGAEGAESLRQDSIDVPEITFSMPADSPQRFALVIRNSNGGSAVVRFRVTEALPDLPDDVAARPDSPAKHLATAAWLTGLKNGAWPVEAAQALKAKAATEPAAAALFGQIVAGWKLK